MKPRTLVLVVLVMVVLALGVWRKDDVVATVAKLTGNEVRDAARAAGARWGIDPDIIEGIGYVETRWRLGAVNRSGADGARGGSWGPFQLSEKTARAYGYTGAMEAFTQDANLAADWCARILLSRPGGAPTTAEEAAAWWNAGRSDPASMPTVTRTQYVPQLAAAMQRAAEDAAS